MKHFENEGSYLSKDIVVNGDIQTSSNLTVDGTVNGEIVSNQDLKINSTSVINGDVFARSAFLDEGKIIGNVEANDNLEVIGSQVQGNLKGGYVKVAAQLEGNINADSLVFADGNSNIRGNIVTKSLEAAKGTSLKFVGELEIINGEVIASTNDYLSRSSQGQSRDISQEQQQEYEIPTFNNERLDEDRSYESVSSIPAGSNQVSFPSEEELIAEPEEQPYAPDPVRIEENDDEAIETVDYSQPGPVNTKNLDASEYVASTISAVIEEPEEDWFSEDILSVADDEVLNQRLIEEEKMLKKKQFYVNMLYITVILVIIIALLLIWMVTQI